MRSASWSTCWSWRRRSRRWRCSSARSNVAEGEIGFACQANRSFVAEGETGFACQANRSFVAEGETGFACQANRSFVAFAFGDVRYAWRANPIS
jgi:hypothetical protein